MFYTYRQNNSAGYFVRDENVDVYVIIEADSADEANAKALDIGLYFNGCHTGQDCSCCGDRWYEPWDDGTVEPTIYDQPAGVKILDHWYEGGRAIVYYEDGLKRYYNNNGSVVDVRPEER